MTFLYFQNGSTDSVLDSPSGSSDGSGNPGSSGTAGQDPNGDASSDPSGASIVDSSHYITVTGMFCHLLLWLWWLLLFFLI